MRFEVLIKYIIFVKKITRENALNLCRTVKYISHFRNAMGEDTVLNEKHDKMKNEKYLITTIQLMSERGRENSEITRATLSPCTSERGLSENSISERGLRENFAKIYQVCQNEA